MANVLWGRDFKFSSVLCKGNMILTVSKAAVSLRADQVIFMSYMWFLNKSVNQQFSNLRMGRIIKHLWTKLSFFRLLIHPPSQYPRTQVDVGKERECARGRWMETLVLHL